MTTNLLLPQRFQLIWTRCFGQHNKKHFYKPAGNERRAGRIRYYPRDTAQEDEVVSNPSKAWRVQRIIRLKGLPYYEKRLLKDLGLIYNAGQDVAIVKNIPENNVRLWKIKHLVTVDPIVFPFGEPTENDLNHTFLKDNGECVVTKEIKVDEKRLKAAEEFINDKTRLDQDTLKRDSLLKWVRCY